MRKAYSQAQITRISKIVTIIGDQYNLLIFFELTKFGEKSFNELKRMTQINAVTLTRKLRHLELDGLINKRYQGKEVLYSMSPDTDKFMPIIDEISALVDAGQINHL